MLHDWGVIAAAFGYIGLLFVVASYGERLTQVQRGRLGTFIYPLSLAIYCTSWTFFGSVGLATRTSIEFLAIYVGPVLMIAFCTPLLMRIIQLAKSQNITSIADFIAARYGKSQAVAATAAAIAIIGSVPYIALQLKAVASSLETILNQDQDVSSIPYIGDIAFIVTITLAAFAVLFGTRQTDATEHQHGLMLAVATESMVKLIAFLAAGVFVTFFMFGPSDLIDRAMKTPEAVRAIEAVPSIGNFLAMTLLSFLAIMLLPRQFHVSVVENSTEAEVRRARWLFPLYLVAINLFVIPIAIAGLVTFPFGASDSDMYVLALPIQAKATSLSVIVFIGGLSAATAMVIVECVALAIMVSNDIIMPLVLKRRRSSQPGAANFGGFLLKVRRVAIFVIMAMAYLYYHALGAQLAAIGLLSFAAVAQLAPAFLGGLFWRRATARGAMGGMLIGFAVWAYTLFLPSFADLDPRGVIWLSEGPFGIGALRPRALLGTEMTPLIHGVFWSLSLNLLTYIVLSLLRQPTSIERVQADLFVPNELAPIAPNFRRWRTTVTVQDLLSTVAQYLGPERAQQSFELSPPHHINIDRAAPADFRLLRHAEHLIASPIGAASSACAVVCCASARFQPGRAETARRRPHGAALQSRDAADRAQSRPAGHRGVQSGAQLITSNQQFGGSRPAAQYSQIGIPLVEISNSSAAMDSSKRMPIRLLCSGGLPPTPPRASLTERLTDRNMVVEVRANRMPGGALVSPSPTSRRASKPPKHWNAPTRRSRNASASAPSS